MVMSLIGTTNANKFNSDKFKETLEFTKMRPNIHKARV